MSQFDIDDIPEFDVLAGGPPCIEFSASKGSRGNILEGLRLVQAFLRVVHQRKPEYWIMENVPRIILHLPEDIPLRWIGVEEDGYLHVPVRAEFNCAEYGVPQARKRFLMGDYPMPEKTSYDPATDGLLGPAESRTPWRSLGEVVNSFPDPMGSVGSRSSVIDPNYDVEVSIEDFTDHFHMSLPDDVAEKISVGDARLVNQLDGFQGVEFKCYGRQVVAPGSIHPDTGEPYELDTDTLSLDLVHVADAPDELIRAIVRDIGSSKAVAGDGQDVTPEQLADALDQLDPAAFRDHDDWFPLMVACHAATKGEGLDEFAIWSTSDPEYAHAGSDIAYRWDTFNPDKPGGITVLSLRHILQKHDATLHTAQDDFAELDDSEVGPPKLKNRLLSLDELFRLPPPEWLVDHAIPKNSLTVLYGPPKSAKTFLAIDIALSIATGREDIHGFECQAGRVLYILAEGGAAMMGNRAKAWIKHHSRECTSDFAILDQAVTLSSQESVDRLLDDMEGETWDLVIVDTLARCMDGDENSVKDMNLEIKGCDYIRRKTGVAVLLVHHSGKDQSKGMRRSTALLGAIDATIKMRPQGTMGRFELSVPELRYGEPTEPKWLSLQSSDESAVLVEGAAPVCSKNGTSADILGFVGRVIADGAPRKEVADEIAVQFGFTARTARRRIVDHIPFGKEHAAETGGMKICREADMKSSSPRAEVVRIVAVRPPNAEIV